MKIAGIFQDFLAKRWGKGESNAATRRREENKAAAGTMHTGRPGEVIELSRGRTYVVAKDGSFRRQGGVRVRHHQLHKAA